MITPGPHRVAVTGVGVVAPGGIGREAFWTTLTEGRTATRRISFFDPAEFRSQIAAEVDFEPLKCGLSPQEVYRNDRFVQFAMVAADEAVVDSGLRFGVGGASDAPEPERIAVVLGSAVGATMRLENEYVAVSNHGRDWIPDPQYGTRFLHHALVPSSLATEIAIRYEANGPAIVVSTGCTSGIDAVGYASQLIADGEATVVLTGASDAPISPISMACFDTIRATSAHNDDPARASRPFDLTRDGFVMGEGAAVLILEDLAHARRRGAPVYCEVTGYANRCNAFHMTGLRPDGIEMAAAIDDAMAQDRTAGRVRRLRERARVRNQAERPARDRRREAFSRSARIRHAHELDQVHGGAQPGRDRLDRGRGDIVGGAPGRRSAHGELRDSDPECDLDYVPKIARDHRVPVALSVGSGFGGFQSAIVLAKAGG